MTPFSAALIRAFIFLPFHFFPISFSNSSLFLFSGDLRRNLIGKLTGTINLPDNYTQLPKFNIFNIVTSNSSRNTVPTNPFGDFLSSYSLHQCH
ncbi:hypothetical protein MtrunA17_Chr6g0455561 [Medicago truncatula]|uniref:Transmembrane protein, putative n=1 Tax=Medicago truncatula TaxID=3880 RepID=A0A072UH80_MEDTR|nr:transmembrane protein, putative [Medicago truncatula]RHN50263.1 hypothetical protein MtrunA17_Chr6g0455561 [Medicago truncatula]